MGVMRRLEQVLTVCSVGCHPDTCWHSELMAVALNGASLTFLVFGLALGVGKK